MMKSTMIIAGLTTACLTAPAALGQAEPFVGQITPTAATFCPRGWTEAHGQLIAISQNEALFSLFGTMYGGDGRTTFGLPDLRGRMMTHAGDGPGVMPVNQGEMFGANTVVATTANLPAHNHTFGASVQVPDTGSLQNAMLGEFTNRPAFATASAMTSSLASGTISASGGSQSMNIQQPYTVVRWCVALYGIFPSRN